MMQQFSHPVDPATYDARDPFWRTPGATRHHLGSDYMVPEGTPVHAAADGVVVVSQWSSVLGNVVGVQNDDGSFISYAHGSSRLVTAGQRVVRAVTVVILSGNTGSASQGDHLHVGLGSTLDAIFGMEPLVDPFAYIQARLTVVTPNELGEQDMALNDGGYIVEQTGGGPAIRGAIFGPDVPGGVIVDDSSPIENLQAMGNLAGVRAVNPTTGFPVRMGAPLKYVGKAEFDATVALAKKIWGA